MILNDYFCSDCDDLVNIEHEIRIETWFLVSIQKNMNDLYLL